MSDLYTKTYFTNKYIDYLVNMYIREYDIRRAGQSALLVSGYIDENKYKYLCSLSRYERQVQTGLLIRDDPVMDKARKGVIEETRRQFIEANMLEDGDILSIKNDAIYVIQKTPTVLKFFDGRMEFVAKNTYTSYYRYGRTEIYYFNDVVTNFEKVDVKNISDEALEMHREYFLDFLMYLFGLAQTSSRNEVICALQEMMTRLINMDLSLGYYREFNSRSKFKLKVSEFTDYYADFLPEGVDRSIIDINQNLDILRHFYKMFSSMYFGNK